MIFWATCGLVGVYSALAGVGGGFLMVPALLYFYPSFSPAAVSAVSMTLVLANSGMVGLSMALKGLTDRRIVAVFGLFSLPGLFVGVGLNRSVDISSFKTYLALILLMVAAWLVLRSLQEVQVSNGEKNKSPRIRWWMPPIGFVIGVFASFFGLGGGIFYVPLFFYGLGLGLRTSVATSHMVLALNAVVTLVPHALLGSLEGHGQLLLGAIPLMVGGGLLGQRLAQHVKSQWIVRGLALVMALMGLRFLLG